MKITLPENISEITLRQFLKYEELQKRNLDAANFNKRKINIFTGIPINQIDNMKGVDATRILNQIDLALSVDAEFCPTFIMHDIEFGFIPNFDKIDFNELTHLLSYKEDEHDLSYLMHILFRPIKQKEGGKYDIITFHASDEQMEFIKDMPLHVVNGALVFFWNLANELQEATLKFLTEELRKDTNPKTISKSSVGIRLLKSWLKTTYSRLIK